MKTIIVVLMIFSSSAFASKKLNLKPQAEKKVEDPASAEHLLYESPQKVEANSIANNPKFKAQASCTDQLGMVHKSGDKGYEACLRNVGKTQPNSGVDPKRSSLGITIGN